MIKNILFGLLLLILGTAIGRFTLPTKVVEKEKIVYQDKVIIQKEQSSDTSKKNNKVYVKLVTIKPDGTRVEETKIYDNSQIEITQDNRESSTQTVNSTTEKEKTTTYNNNSLLIAAQAKVQFDNLTPKYGILIEKRLLGPIWIGGFGFIDGSAGLNLGLTF